MSVSDRESVLDNNVKKGAKYKPLDKKNWKRSIVKMKRLSGQTYVSISTKKQVPGKSFTLVKKCCGNECFKNFNHSEQKETFQLFYSCNTKESQDTFVAGCMTIKDDQERIRKTVNVIKERNFTWTYKLKNSGREVEVCRAFLLSILQLSVKRIRCIQKKVREGDSFCEKRGKHGNQRKFEPNVWELAMEHLKSIPHRPSHYGRDKSNRLYFTNSELSIKNIYEAFKDFFKGKTGNTLQMKYKTYFKFFRETNFTFKKPKSDTCDFCKECEIKLTVNPNDDCKIKYTLHKKKADKAAKMKADFIANAKDNEEVLVLEFDYAQNLPLPKLTVTKQFYKRLLWLYMFNIHCHNDSKSAMYTFLESQSKKGPDSVASFLFDFITKRQEDFPNLKKIVLLSDATGGQNKNATMLKFCSYLAKSLGVEVIQLFPVRGHSFGQCDRNFGVFKSSVKKTEEIHVPQPYLDKILSCRTNPSPFVLVNDMSIMYDWTSALAPYFDKVPKSKGSTFGIQKYPIIKYKPCGTLAVSKSYELIYEPFKYMIRTPNELAIANSPRILLKGAKMKDVRDLYPNLLPEERQFYEDFFSNEQRSETNEVAEMEVTENNEVAENNDQDSDSDPDDIADDDY